MDTRHFSAVTSRHATRALGAARVLMQIDGYEPSNLAKRLCLLGQLEPPV